MDLQACCKLCDWAYITTDGRVGDAYFAWNCAVHGPMVKAWLTGSITGEVMTRPEFERKLSSVGA